MSLTIAATGHRPKALPTGYNLAPLIAIAKPWLAARKPDTVISGMALGWDTAVAIAALELGIKTVAFIPFVGQADGWPIHQQTMYQNLLLQCAEIKVICPPGYEAWKMQARNEAMVDACDEMLALWNGEKGGTGNCVDFAIKRRKKIVNLWSEYAFEV